jgi:hypothetical protein
LKFSAVENHAGTMTVIARMGHSLYASVGLSKQVALDTAWQDFELYFDGSVSDTACRVDFQVSITDSLIWLDKVSLYEINDAGLTRDLRAKCFYNAKNSNDVFSLGSDTWRDVSGTRGMRGSIALPAFLSRVMIKDSMGVVNGVIGATRMMHRANMLKIAITASGLFKVDFELQKKQDVVIDVCDMRGKKVFSTGSLGMDAGKHSKYLGDKRKGIATGVYVVRLYGTVDRLVQKFVKLR